MQLQMKQFLAKSQHSKVKASVHKNVKVRVSFKHVTYDKQIFIFQL